ncbi:hypothetical protein HSX37_18370|uniref:Uncharacterized protein n=1 Tax=Dendrosporobacter quercicolus TaxID=146817 RepID=A0A1H0A2K0_9FIRM|nr:hypothetical protein [Dendrosporobacter quercicolus]NSL49986.1 hypothetical protein [Dendrosporobacter quercicolus DSM 1736]SDN27441.1 hypothetical protein SAMN04488502_11630 [Dendrosporobacter quercicolus]
MSMLTRVVYGLFIAVLGVAFTLYTFGLVIAAPFLILIKNCNKLFNRNTLGSRKLQNV